MDGTASWAPDWESAPAQTREEAFPTQKSLTDSVLFKEVSKLFGVRPAEDSENDRLSTKHYLAHPELEANITNLTKMGLMKDADSTPPVKNPDGSTTYTLVQIGLSNRPYKKDDAAEDSVYYSRDVRVTVPASAKNLSECDFQFLDRKHISEDEFNKILNRDRSKLIAPFNNSKENKNKEAGDVEFYTHGVFTGDKLADSQALLLELTNGRPTVTIDWPAYANDYPDYIGGLSFARFLHYMEDRASAIIAGTKLAPAIDKTINSVGADHSVMIGFSHGGMFNARYLRHRVDRGLPRVQTQILAHPDLPIQSPELYFDIARERMGLLSASSDRSIVIGGESDKQLSIARLNPLAKGARLGNDASETRKSLKNDNTLAITEHDRKTPDEDQHILNYAGIASLLNNEYRPSAQVRTDYIKATEDARKK